MAAGRGTSSPWVEETRASNVVAMSWLLQVLPVAAFEREIQKGGNDDGDRSREKQNKHWNKPPQETESHKYTARSGIPRQLYQGRRGARHTSPPLRDEDQQRREPEVRFQRP